MKKAEPTKFLGARLSKLKSREPGSRSWIDEAQMCELQSLNLNQCVKTDNKIVELECTGGNIQIFQICWTWYKIKTTKKETKCHCKEPLGTEPAPMTFAERLSEEPGAEARSRALGSSSCKRTPLGSTFPSLALMLYATVFCYLYV